MLNIYTINLAHRKDRWEEAQANYRACGLNPDAVQRWEASSEPGFGALGCAKSHVAALAHYLTQGQAPYCLVLEDDFDFVRPWSEFVDCFRRAITHQLEWDVILMMGTAVLATPSPVEGLARVIESQSTAGYLVSRRYAADLLACFAASLTYLERFRAPDLHRYAIPRMAVDMAWKPLQRRDRWYIATPALGHQRTSWSDIEQCATNYDAITFGMSASGA